MRTQSPGLACICLLLLALAMPLRAQIEPSISVTPAAGAVERAVFAIEIDGLQADAPYAIEILFQGEVVFSSEETSDQAGHIPYPVSSTAGDLPGIYSVRVRSQAGQIVASAEFELLPKDSAPAPGRGSLIVSPASAPFGKSQTVRVMGLAPGSAHLIEITASQTGATAYRRRLESDAQGRIEIEIFASEGDAPGHHAVAVFDAEGNPVAEGEFTIVAPSARDVALRLSPATIAAGDALEISLSGLAAFDAVSAQITSADGVLIDAVSARASGAGDASLLFQAPTTLSDGLYAATVFVDGARVAEAVLNIGEASATVAVDPPAASIGSRHDIRVSGLGAGQAFVLRILDPQGAEEHRSARQADSDGAFQLTVSSTEQDKLGLYTVEIRGQDGQSALAMTTFTVTAAVDQEPPAEPIVSEAVAKIEPQAAPLGSSHRISVSNLAAGETVAFDVVFAGETVYQSEKTADAQGRATLELITSDADAPGDYEISVLRDAGNQPSVILRATEAATIARPPASENGDSPEIAGKLRDGEATVEFSGRRARYTVMRVSADGFDPAATLLDRDGMELAANDDSRGAKAATIGPLRLPYSGTYELRVSAKPLMMPQLARTGAFTVTIEEVEPAELAFDEALDFSLDAATSALYFALPVLAGDSLSAAVNSGLDTQLQVVSPAGLEVAFDDDSGPGFDAELSQLVFDEAGDYILTLAAFEPGASGAGTLTVSRNPARSLEAGAAVVTLNDKSIRDLVVFEAAEDESLILNLRTLYGAVEDLYVRATVDGMEVMAYSTMGVPAELPLPFVMPMSGRVLVELEKFGFDDGIALEVSLERR